MNSPTPCKILVIDDEESFRVFLTRLLLRHGFEPVVASDGPSGLALARQTAPDLVLCDLGMPGMNGYLVLEAFQRDPALVTIPVIFLTGWSEPAQIREGMNLGADDYLTKPVKQDDLLNAIKARLSRVRRLRQERTAPAAPPPVKCEDSFLVTTSTDKRLIKIKEISHLLACGEYSWVYWHKGRGAMLRKSLKQWLAELPRDQFLRVHRGAIINLAFLERVEKVAEGAIQVWLREVSVPVPVSVRLRASLNRHLKGSQSSHPHPAVTSE